MMDLDLWTSFVMTVGLLAFTPGPSVLLVSANSLGHGFKNTLGTILGDLSANLVQMMLATAGLASLLMASGEMFLLMKWAGVIYLIAIGVKKFFSKGHSVPVSVDRSRSSFRRFYLQGFLVSASNPKAIIFFSALFPVFIHPGLAFIPQIATLALTFILLDGLSLLLYARFAMQMQRILADRQRLGWLNRIVGSLLIGSGIFLSFVRRSHT